jgi:hypothetical protein
LDQKIEIAIQHPGHLSRCFVLGDDGERVAELPIAEFRERFTVDGIGVVSIDLHSFRVKRTTYKGNKIPCSNCLDPDGYCSDGECLAEK